MQQQELLESLRPKKIYLPTHHTISLELDVGNARDVFLVRPIPPELGLKERVKINDKDVEDISKIDQNI